MREDMVCDPQHYGRGALEQMALAWPLPGHKPQPAKGEDPAAV